jgi:hypothetical protein
MNVCLNLSVGRALSEIEISKRKKLSNLPPLKFRQAAVRVCNPIFDA